MATATITIKKGTTAEWTEAKRVLDDGELGLETTPSGHRIIRIGNGSTEFMQLPVAFDIEEIREIKQGMDTDAKAYYDDMVKRGEEYIKEIKAMATTVELTDDATAIKYRMGISNGTLYFEEMEKTTGEEVTQ
nr:MAG TPA: hyaluronidase [Caudoviricetes sp.]